MRQILPLSSRVKQLPPSTAKLTIRGQVLIVLPTTLNSLQIKRMGGLPYSKKSQNPNVIIINSIIRLSSRRRPQISHSK